MIDPFFHVVLHRDNRPRCEIVDRNNRSVLRAEGKTPKQALRRMTDLIDAIIEERRTGAHHPR
jgi:hypothetical protein